MAKAKNQINFTHRVLDKLPLPERGKRNTVFDSQVNGLNVVITDRGVKTFYLRKVVQGRQARLFIGRYPDLSVEKAREKANTCLSQIAEGKKPQPDIVIPMEKTETETVSQTVTATESETVPETVEKQNNTFLRRGDRFICPKTGEQLQVRAVGGCPKRAKSFA